MPAIHPGSGISCNRSKTHLELHLEEKIAEHRRKLRFPRRSGAVQGERPCRRCLGLTLFPRPGQGLWVYSIWIPFNTGIWYFFLAHFGYKVSCFSWILDIQFIDMNQMFTVRSKRLFSQGSVLQFWGILVSYGGKIGYIGIPLPPWLSLISTEFLLWRTQLVCLKSVGILLTLPVMLCIGEIRWFLVILGINTTTDFWVYFKISRRFYREYCRKHTIFFLYHKEYRIFRLLYVSISNLTGILLVSTTDFSICSIIGQIVSLALKTPEGSGYPVVIAVVSGFTNKRDKWLILYCIDPLVSLLGSFKHEDICLQSQLQ